MVERPTPPWDAPGFARRVPARFDGPPKHGDTENTEKNISRVTSKPPGLGFSVFSVFRGYQESPGLTFSVFSVSPCFNRPKRRRKTQPRLGAE